MESKYCVLITYQGKRITELPNRKSYAIMEKHSINLGNTDKEIIKICNKIEKNIEAVKSKGIKIKFDVLLDSEIKHFEKLIYGRLGTVETIQIK